MKAVSFKIKVLDLTLFSREGGGGDAHCARADFNEIYFLKC